MLVGPPGSRKRVRAKSQKKEKESGDQVGAEDKDTHGEDDAAGELGSDQEDGTKGQDTDGGDAAAGNPKSNQEDGAEDQDTNGRDDAAGERENQSREAEEGIQDMDPREFIGQRGSSDTGIQGMHPDMLRGPPGPRSRRQNVERSRVVYLPIIGQY